MQLRFDRRLMGLGLALALTLGSACGTRLDKAAIVSAHDGTGSQSLAAGPAAGGSFGATVPGAASTAGSGAAADTGSASPAAAGSTAGGTTGVTGNGTAAGGAAGSGSSGAAAAGTKAGSAATPGAAGSRTAAGTAAGPSGSGGAGPGSPGAGQGAAKPGTPGGGGAPAAASGAPILVGALGQTSGIVGAAVGPALPALQAWTAATNAAGGIKGHPVKLFFADDGGDPARARQLVQQLVERDHVISFVMHFTPLAGQATVDYLNQKRIPVTGDSGAGQWFYQSPMFFPQFCTGQCWVRAMIYGAAAETVPQGKSKLAMLNCQEAQFCVDADRLWPGLASKVGYNVVFRRQASLAQPDYTAECLGARNAGADVFGLAMDGNAIGRIASACARVNFHPIYFIHHSALLVDHAKDPNLDGILVPLASRAWFDTSNPVVAAYQKALSSYAPGAEAKDPSFAGWAAAQQFQAAANAAPDPTTTEGIL
ncbi:MAG TPA: ABC transporter substrate-binding protein, partial [Acidimicrobiia bacterium]|nr:ABC transporter substrate-binding protein [Acidimicrobiia bacterium]